MGVKVSEMPTASTINENDWLMIVQGGENKKIDANLFQLKSEASANSLKLEGHPASDFLPANGIATNSSKLGGIDANLYATKEYVDSHTGGSNGGVEAWEWCMPKLWISAHVLPDNDDTENWHFCDGAWLDKTEYPDLFDTIGYAFSWQVVNETWVHVESGDLFRIPDLSGKFILGANTGTLRNTVNLPTGLYHGQDFTSNGQYKYPQDAGKWGGCPITTMDSESQIVKHAHIFQERSIVHQCKRGSGPYGHPGDDDKDDPIRSDRYTSLNVSGNITANAQYPNDDFGVNGSNTGMLSMPPYFSFAFVMRIKKATNSVL